MCLSDWTHFCSHALEHKEDNEQSVIIFVTSRASVSRTTFAHNQHAPCDVSDYVLMRLSVFPTLISHSFSVPCHLFALLPCQQSQVKSSKGQRLAAVRWRWLHWKTDRNWRWKTMGERDNGDVYRGAEQKMKGWSGLKVILFLLPLFIKKQKVFRDVTSIVFKSLPCQ